MFAGDVRDNGNHKYLVWIASIECYTFTVNFAVSNSGGSGSIEVFAKQDPRTHACAAPCRTLRAAESQNASWIIWLWTNPGIDLCGRPK